MDSDWRQDASCADGRYDPNTWFADPAEAKDRAAAQLAREHMCTARDVCRMCPVRSECLDYAMYRPFLQGIWGGLSDEERNTLRKVRSRNDHSLVFGLYPEPDLSAYIGGGNMLGRQSDAIVKALRARRVCKECGVEKDYYISRLVGRCRDCAMSETAKNDQNLDAVS